MIQETLSRIQKELKAPKGQFNNFGGYNYRSCEDIVEAVKPLLGEAILTLSDEIVMVGTRYYVKAMARLSEINDNKIELAETYAFAREAEVKKGMDEAQITGSASSYARKYALNGLFAIDDTQDADAMDNTQKPPTTPKSAPQPPKNLKLKTPPPTKSIDFIPHIENAPTIYELSKIGLELKTAKIDPDMLPKLRELFAKKMKELGGKKTKLEETEELDDQHFGVDSLRDKAEEVLGKK